jgi:hypothetical protein
MVTRSFNELRGFRAVNTVEPTVVCNVSYKRLFRVMLTLRGHALLSTESRIAFVNSANTITATDDDLEPALQELSQLPQNMRDDLRDSRLKQ